MLSGHLILEDGTAFPGTAVGALHDSGGEICFTTSMCGYEEAVTDPSYARQVLAFSYPLIGNYGVDASRMESDRVHTAGVVARTLRPAFATWLAEHQAPALSGVDTRALVRHVRDRGAMRCAIGTASPAELLELALAEPHIDVDRMLENGVVRDPPAYEVCVREPFTVGAGPRIVVLDFGCKRSIVRSMVERGLQVVLLPGTAGPQEVLALNPLAVLVSNGPGDPAQLIGAVETVRQLLGRVPVFGICLGHQLLGLALGLKTFSLPFGHRGANHPVRVCNSRRVLVTVQNHGFAVEAPAGDEWVTHVSLNDGTVEGLAGDGFASVQFHPEAAPGPHDALPFFDQIADRCRGAVTYRAS